MRWVSMCVCARACGARVRACVRACAFLRKHGWVDVSFGGVGKVGGRADERSLARSLAQSVGRSVGRSVTGRAGVSAYALCPGHLDMLFAHLWICHVPAAAPSVILLKS